MIEDLVQSKPMNTFLIRTISAVVAALGIILLYFFLHADGLKLVCFLAAIFCTFELMRLIFKASEPTAIKSTFFLFTILDYLMTTLKPEYSALSFTTLSVLFFSFSLFFQGRFSNLGELENFQAKGILGMFYVGLLPGLTTRILFLKDGVAWFVCLLIVVFSGDIFAYLVGSKLGKHRLLPAVSPKKSIEGSVAGLAASSISASVILGFFTSAPVWFAILLGLIAGAIAQCGDLFESELKRVANVKDSGRIMPGHGGMLDRIDGVLFAAPILLVGATLIEKLF